MSEPKLSVVIPALNAERFVGAAVCTAAVAVTRSSVEREIVVVDHESTDGTAMVATIALQSARRLGVHETRIVTAQRGGGPARAKNVGFAASSGDLVTFLDADDVMEDVDPRIAALLRRPHAIASLARIGGLIDAAGDPIIDPAFSAWCNRGYAVARAEGTITARAIASGAIPGYFTMVYRRAGLEKVGPFDESLLRAEDFDMAYRCALAGEILFVDVPAVSYRIHGSNTSVFISGGTVRVRAETREDHASALRKHGLA